MSDGPMKHDAELMRLLSALCDESITDGELAKLESIMRDDPAARTLYRRYVDMAAELQVRSPAVPQPTVSITAPAGHDSSVNPGERTDPRSFRIQPAALAIAAAVVLCAAVAAIYVIALGFEALDPHDPLGNPVATLIDSTGTVIVNDDIGNPGNEYGAGEYTMDSGVTDFLLTSNVSVNVRGDCRLTVYDSMRVSVARGTARFVVPRGAVGFTVALPGGTRLVDLGTEFEVTTDPLGPSTFRVTDGRVEVRHRDTPPVALVAGEHGRIESDGRLRLFRVVARDDASDSAYDDGLQTGDNGGFGFKPWTINAPVGTAAAGIADASRPYNDIGSGDHGRSWAMSVARSSGLAAIRMFAEPLPVGGSVEFDFDHGPMPSGDTNVALITTNGRVQFYAQYIKPNYIYRSRGVSDDLIDTGLPRVTTGVRVRYRQVTPDRFALDVTPIGTNDTTTVRGESAGRAIGIAFGGFDLGDAPGHAYATHLNNLVVIGESPSTIPKGTTPD